MKRKLILSVLILLVSAISCPGAGTYPFLSNPPKKIYKSSVCDPDRPFPQMVVIPHFVNATQVVPNCRVYPKHKTAFAMMIFYHHWVRNFGDHDLRIKRALEKVMITWGLEKKIAKSSYNRHGKRSQGKVITGMTKSDSVIWVWRGHDFKISESSLIHELVHVSLRAINGHGDADHEGPKYNGWTEHHTYMINEAKRTLRMFNL